MTPVPKDEREILMPRTSCSGLVGDDLMRPIMILPFSHSPSVETALGREPSQAMRTARHQHGGRCDSYEGSCAAARPIHL